MIRLVLDTNVIVSALLRPAGPPGRVMDLALSGAAEVLVDPRILGEYREVLARPRLGLDVGLVSEFVSLLELVATAVVARPFDGDLPDEGDRPFIEVARSGRASALITGNRRHCPAEALGWWPAER